MSTKIVIENRGSKTGDVTRLVKWFMARFGYMKAKELLAKQYQIILHVEPVWA